MPLQQSQHWLHEQLYAQGDITIDGILLAFSGRSNIRIRYSSSTERPMEAARLNHICHITYSYTDGVPYKYDQHKYGTWAYMLMTLQVGYFLVQLKASVNLLTSNYLRVVTATHCICF